MAWLNIIIIISAQILECILQYKFQIALHHRLCLKFRWNVPHVIERFGAHCQRLITNENQHQKGVDIQTGWRCNICHLKPKTISTGREIQDLSTTFKKAKLPATVSDHFEIHRFQLTPSPRQSAQLTCHEAEISALWDQRVK